ncbi:MAG TPA: sugar phosphate nucleotidyltransferase, partial [Gillisia sp.]|nr:sugar phosphate nucleotidyltransferase [Gillisia sp.]
ETLLQLTYNRFATMVLPENILILTNEIYKDIVLEQLPKLKEDQVILEPVMRNTAPCILLAAMKIKKKNPHAIMLVAPSDHWIKDKEAFKNDINLAFESAAREDILVTLGIQPDYPNTGFGYIKYEDAGQEGKNATGLHKVEKFTEKPTLRNARKYLENGNYLWNAGIFIWKASGIVNSFEKLSPQMFGLFESGIDELNGPGEEEFIKENFPKSQNISIDYAILEKSDNVYVIPASFDWDDLGTWGALYSKLAKDTQKNAVVNAKLMPLETNGNMIYTHNHKVVIIDGLEDYIIVDDKDVLLIVPKEKEQEIKEIRAAAIEKYGENLG